MIIYFTKEEACFCDPCIKCFPSCKVTPIKQTKSYQHKDKGKRAHCSVILDAEMQTKTVELPQHINGR